METPLLEAGPSFSERDWPPTLETDVVPSNEEEVCDWIVIFNMVEGKKQPWKKWASRFQEVGLTVHAYKSVQGDEVYMKIRASLKALEDRAERDRYPMVLDPKILEEKMWREIPHTTRFKPFKYIHAPYVARKRELYKKAKHVTRILDHPFSALHRAKLVLRMMDAPRDDLGAGFGVTRRVVKDDAVKGYIVLHDQGELDYLNNEFIWKRCLPHALDTTMIVNYWGARVGFVFSFRQHLTTAVAPLGLVGVVVFIVTKVRGDVSNVWTAAFAILVAIWSLIVMQVWRRVESTNKMKWGSHLETLHATTRAGFHGVRQASAVDGAPTLYYPPRRRRHKILLHTVPIVLFFGIFAAAFVGIIVMRFRFADRGDSLSYIPSVVNGVVIQILNFLYTTLAVKLTDRENWRTDAEYEDALILKLMLFTFVNSNSSLYFTAFVRRHIGHGGCVGDDDSNLTQGDACLDILASSLLVLYLSQIVVNKIIEQVVPYVQSEIQRYFEGEGTDRRFSRGELEFFLQVADPHLYPIQLMAYTFVEFCYITLFVAAFPLAPFLSFVNGAVSQRTSAYTLMYRFRRILPLSAANGIGTFNIVYDVVCSISVVTNAGLIVYTANIPQLRGLSPLGKVWLFVIIQYVLFSLSTIIDVLIADELHDVDIQRKRNTFFVNALIYDQRFARVDAPLFHEEDDPPFDDDGKCDDVVLHDKDDGPYSRRPQAFLLAHHHDQVAPQEEKATDPHLV